MEGNHALRILPAIADWLGVRTGRIRLRRGWWQFTAVAAHTNTATSTAVAGSAGNAAAPAVRRDGRIAVAMGSGVCA